MKTSAISRASFLVLPGTLPVQRVFRGFVGQSLVRRVVAGSENEALALLLDAYSEHDPGTVSVAPETSRSAIHRLRCLGAGVYDNSRILAIGK